MLSQNDTGVTLVHDPKPMTHLDVAIHHIFDVVFENLHYGHESVPDITSTAACNCVEQSQSKPLLLWKTICCGPYQNSLCSSVQ